MLKGGDQHGTHKVFHRTPSWRPGHQHVGACFVAEHMLADAQIPHSDGVSSRVMTLVSLAKQPGNPPVSNGNAKVHRRAARYQSPIESIFYASKQHTDLPNTCDAR